MIHTQNTNRVSPAAAALGTSVSYASMILMPILTSTYITVWKLTPSSAGFVTALQLICAAVGSLYISRRIGSTNINVVNKFAVSSLIFAGALTIYTSHQGLLIFCRAIVGLSEGLIMASLNVAIARSTAAKTLFAVSQTSVSLSSILLFAITPAAAGIFGEKGVYVFILLLYAISAPFILQIYVRKEAPSQTTEHPKPILRINTCILLVGVTLSFIGAQAIWAYLEQIGMKTGASSNEVVISLGVGAALAVLGPAIANFCMKKISPKSLTIFALSGLAIVAVTATSATDKLLFLVSSTPKQAIALFYTTVLFSWCGELDNSGRIAAALHGCINAGTAAAPIFAAAILFLGTYELIGLMSAACELLAAGSILLFSWRMSVLNRNNSYSGGAQA